MSTLAKRMQEALADLHGLKTQAGLARACRVSTASVSNWFTGQSKSLRGANALAAAAYLEVRPEWLTTGRGPKRPPPPTRQQLAMLTEDGMEPIAGSVYAREAQDRVYAAGTVLSPRQRALIEDLNHPLPDEDVRTLHDLLTRLRAG